MKKAAFGLLALATGLALAPPAITTGITGSVAIAGLDTYSGTGIRFLGPSL